MKICGCTGWIVCDSFIAGVSSGTIAEEGQWGLMSKAVWQVQYSQGWRQRKTRVLPRTTERKFHQSTPAEAPATRPSCFDQRWPETQRRENELFFFFYTYIRARTGDTKPRYDSAVLYGYSEATSQVLQSWKCCFAQRKFSLRDKWVHFMYTLYSPSFFCSLNLRGSTEAVLQR